MSDARPGIACALGLGAVSGARASGAWVGLAARGRIADPRLRLALLAAGAGEACGDQLPSAPPRSAPPALAGRVLSGALSGRWAAGTPGALAGAAMAAVSAVGTQRLRAAVVAGTGLPDRVYGALEDAIVFAAAAALAGDGQNSAASGSLR